MFIFCIAWPPAPLIKLSIAEKIIILFFIFNLQTEISQKFVFITFSVPIFLLILATFTKYEFFLN